ncbi:MAG: hypothetical protein ABW189_01405 [Rickettsiales bacterium]
MTAKKTETEAIKEQPVTDVAAPDLPTQTEKTEANETDAKADAKEYIDALDANAGDKPLCFGAAVELLRHGHAVARAHMGKIGLRISSVGAFGLLYVLRKDGSQAKYTPTDEDIFAEDWRVVPSENPETLDAAEAE